MKKFILGASLALAVVATGCSKAGDATDEYAVDKATSDSIATTYGRLFGSNILNEYNNLPEEQFEKGSQMKADIIKGMRAGMAIIDSRNTMMGVQLAMALYQQIDQLEQQGVEVDKEAMVRNFIAVFSADTVDVNTAQTLSDQYRELLAKVDDLKTKRDEAKAATAPEAVQNEQAGKAFIDNLKAKDAEVKTTESGLSYKIIEHGDTTTITDQTVVAVNYTGKLTDGTVFDASEGEPVSFSPSSVVPGFGEGLKLLGKGGKAVLYIPGNLAYGVHGVPQAGIGPNQTLVFEIEIVDVK